MYLISVIRFYTKISQCVFVALLIQLWFPLAFSKPSGNEWRVSTNSLLKIDPQRIVSKIVQHSGLILPKPVENDINVIKAVCQCDAVTLDVIKRELEVFNFTVTSPNSELNDAIRSLRVGRFLLKWDSYLKPCVEIEIDDIDIWVEFLNLLLTRSNWNELQEYGFPPSLLTDDSSGDSSANSFVRIGGIDFGGAIKLRLRSRPLEQNLCEDIVFDLQMLDDLSTRINDAAKNNISRQAGGRKGCTTDELYKIIDKYFRQKTQKIVKDAAIDIVKSKLSPNSDSKTVLQARKAFVGAKDNISNYAQRVKDRTSNQVEEVVSQKMARLGLDSSVVELMKRTKDKLDEGDTIDNSFHDIVAMISAKMEEKMKNRKESTQISEDQFKNQKVGQQTSKDAPLNRKKKSDERDTDIHFADW